MIQIHGPLFDRAVRRRYVGVLLSLGAVFQTVRGSAMQKELPSGFIEVVVDAIKWVANPTVPGSDYAVLVGDPSKPGPLVVRARLPPNVRIDPHTHPDARTYTVLAGEWKLGFGETFDPSALRTYPAGSVYRLPARVPHFQATGPVQTSVQIESVGPTSTDFIPRR